MISVFKITISPIRHGSWLRSCVTLLGTHFNLLSKYISEHRYLSVCFCCISLCGLLTYLYCDEIRQQWNLYNLKVLLLVFLLLSLPHCHTNRYKVELHMFLNIHPTLSIQSKRGQILFSPCYKLVNLVIFCHCMKYIMYI